MAKQALIERFVQTYDYIQSSLDKNNIDEANKYYPNLHQIYSMIDKSNLDPINKEIAYDKLTEIYNGIQKFDQKKTPANNKTQGQTVKTKKSYYTNPALNTKKEVKSKKGPESFTDFFIHHLKPRDFAIVTVVILLIAAVIFINPEYVGLASFADHTSLVHSVDYTFDKDSDYIVTLKDIPTSLKVSGEVIGGGRAVVSVDNNGERLVIFDSDNKLFVQNGKFEIACIDTCFIEDFNSRNLKLLIDVDSGTQLFISELGYTVQDKINNVPAWVEGKPRVFEVKQGGSIALDLTKYFEDRDGDELTFLSTGSENLLINVGDTTLVITPKTNFVGEEVLTVIASDLKDIVRVPIEIVVKGTAIEAAANVPVVEESLEENSAEEVIDGQSEESGLPLITT